MARKRNRPTTSVVVSNTEAGTTIVSSPSAITGPAPSSARSWESSDVDEAVEAAPCSAPPQATIKTRGVSHVLRIEVSSPCPAAREAHRSGSSVEAEPEPALARTKPRPGWIQLLGAQPIAAGTGLVRQ